MGLCRIPMNYSKFRRVAMVAKGVATVAKSRDGQAGEGTLPMKGMTQ